MALVTDAVQPHLACLMDVLSVKWWNSKGADLVGNLSPA